MAEERKNTEKEKKGDRKILPPAHKVLNLLIHEGVRRADSQEEGRPSPEKELEDYNKIAAWCVALELSYVPPDKDDAQSKGLEWLADELAKDQDQCQIKSISKRIGITVTVLRARIQADQA